MSLTLFFTLRPIANESVTRAAAMTIARMVCTRTGNQTSVSVVGIENDNLWGWDAPHDYNNPRKVVSTENQVTLNGERRAFPAQTTLFDVVKAIGLEPERVAIEYNRAIVKRELWSSTALDDDAEIEIVQFVGGG